MLRKATALALLATVALAALAAAPRPAAAGERTTVQVMQIRASNDGPAHMDPDLERYRFHTQLDRYPYRSFELLERAQQHTAPGETVTFQLVERHVLHVTVDNSDGDMVHLRLEIRDGQGRQALTTRLKLADRGSTIVCLELADGEALILPLRVLKP